MNNWVYSRIGKLKEECLLFSTTPVILFVDDWDVNQSNIVFKV